MDTTFIYVLKDPETDAVRYVGKSNNPKKAWYRHTRDGRTKHTHKANWVKSLDARGLKPALEIIDEIPKSKLEWPSYECAYIEFFLDQGCDLTNATPGGDCGPINTFLGKKHTLASIEKNRNAHIGKKASPETRAKMRASRKGKKHTLTALAKMSASQKGLAKPPGFGAMVRARTTGKKYSPESCAKRRIKKPGASSAFHGVSWYPRHNSWRACIYVARKGIFLGNFFDEIAAAKACDVAAKKYHGAHAVLNFPD